MESVIGGIEEIDEAVFFDNAEDAFAWAEKNPFDLVFADVMLSGSENGLDLGGKLRRLATTCRIIYCTGYMQYAVDAINRGVADGYLIKPVRTEDVRTLLDRFRHESRPAATLVHVRRDEKDGLALYDRKGEQLRIRRKKALELFAVLLEHDGESMTTEELCARLWEPGEAAGKRQYLYTVANDLQSILTEHGAFGVVYRTGGGYAVDMTRIARE